MPLRDIVQNIVFNETVQDLLTDKLKDHPLKELVDYQRYYKADNFSFEKEGFQPGEPWNGDLKNARILFLSSNPAFSFNEKFPRYFTDTGTFPGTLRTSDGAKMTVDNAMQFFCSRFQEATDNGGLALGVMLVDGNKKSVPYWGSVRNNVESLLPDALKTRKPSLPLYARKLMSYAAIMEIVPFKSNGEVGVTPDALSFCWENFSKHILARSGASIFVLVGNKVRDIFLGLAITDLNPPKFYMRINHVSWHSKLQEYRVVA